MAFGARITLTSPDPSSSTTNPHNEHENTVFSESQTVTYNAQKSSSSSSSTESSAASLDNESIEMPIDLNQRVKATIDSVSPYDSNVIKKTEEEKKKESDERENEANVEFKPLSVHIINDEL